MPRERFSIRVAADRLAAFVCVTAVPAPSPDLRAALAQAGVVLGIDEAALNELQQRSKDPSFEQGELQLASGQAATDGEPGYVVLAFETALAPGRLSDDGHMNFFERGLLKAVTATAVVATIVAPTAGAAGVGVDAQVLPPRAGAAVTLTLGPGVRMTADGAVRAAHDGVVLYKPGESLDVVASHVHQGAVDLRTGHLDMQGSLVVRGDVERLLQARATGDLEVVGSVSGGSLCAGGSIKISGSVRGGDLGRVVAEQDVSVKSCEAAHVTAGGVLRVQEAVSSQLYGQHVVVLGRLRGGVAVAERSLIVNEAGTSAGSVTLLQAGEPLAPPSLEQVQRVVLMQKLRRMAERGGVREAFGSRGGGRAKGGKLGRLDAAEAAEQLQLLSARAAHRAELERAAVVVLGVAHAGVELRIGSARLSVEQTQRDLRYVLDVETGQLVADRSVA